MAKDPRIGKAVTVYHDPLTRELAEGNATLRAVHFGDHDGLVYCEVQFRNGDIQDRWINCEQLDSGITLIPGAAEPRGDHNL